MIRDLFEKSAKVSLFTRPRRFGKTLARTTNDFLELAVVTECLRISKESIFTGLNNLEVNSILTEDFAEYFGYQRIVKYGICFCRKTCRIKKDGARKAGQ